MKTIIERGKIKGTDTYKTWVDSGKPIFMGSVEPIDLVGAKDNRSTSNRTLILQKTIIEKEVSPIPEPTPIKEEIISIRK